MKKQHTSPCRECPFRRVAAAGWLGGFAADEFRHLADADRRMPCHMHMKDGVDYANPGKAPQCAGRAIHWANQFKTPRDRSLGLLQLPQDTVLVFQWPQEFVDHHKAGLLAEVRK